MSHTVEVKKSPSKEFLAVAAVSMGLGRVTLSPEQKLLGSGKEISTRSQEKKYYYNLENDANSPDVIAGVFLEEGTTDDISRRVHKADPYPERRIRQDNWEFNEHAKAEKIATERTFELIRQGDKLVIWLSPEGGSYKEGRLNVYLPAEIDGEPAVQGWGIPFPKNQRETLELAQRLISRGGETVGEIETPEDVRVQPIGFGEGEDWLVRCQKMIPEMAEVWQLIEDGGEVRHKQEVEAVVRENIKQASGDNRYFEWLMLRAGYGLNPEGGHGASYLSGSNSIADRGIFNFTIQRIGGENFTAAQRDKEGRWVCPVCGEKLGEGASVCPKCKIKIK